MKFPIKLDKVLKLRFKFGAKAINLAYILKLGIPIPETYAIPIKVDILNLDLGVLTPDYLYAVRSSALIEDSAKSSYAGLFESFMPVEFRLISKYINEVRASGKKVGVSENQVGVIIQRYIRPKYSGIIFTKDILNKMKNVYTIEVSEGEGHKLASGTTLPTLIQIDIDKHKIVYQEGKNILREAGCFEVIKIASLLRNRFRTEQDIEFCFDQNDKLWILQSRPITTK